MKKITKRGTSSVVFEGTTSWRLDCNCLVMKFRRGKEKICTWIWYGNQLEYRCVYEDNKTFIHNGAREVFVCLWPASTYTLVLVVFALRFPGAGNQMSVQKIVKRLRGSYPTVFYGAPLGRGLGK